MRYQDIPNISAFLARMWFKDASQRVLETGDTSPAYLLTKPALVVDGKRQTFHPIITWTPDEHPDFNVSGQVFAHLSERQALLTIQEALWKAEIL